MHTYNRLPVTFSYGEGVWLVDTEGVRYLDALSGIAVCGLGHSHPAITQAISQQAGKLLHTSNLYNIASQQKLGDVLTGMAGMDRVFFSNSGAEANEAAIKLARLYGNNLKIENPTIIVMNNSFHGRTLATLSATGSRRAHAGFEPLVHGFIRVPYNDLKAIESLSNNRSIVAILVEPIQGEGGINIPSKNYLNGMRSLCDKNNWLMMIDEVQAGMGRTGKFFAFQHSEIKPDVLTLAKALANGVPIGACLAHGKAANLFVPGHHGTTFGGNPLACNAALATCETLKLDNVINNAERIGSEIINGFRQNLSAIEGVIDIRGKGMMIGIELKMQCADLVRLALEKNLLINVTAGNVVRLLPPLIMTTKEANFLVETLSNLIKEFLLGKK
tara:strand:- start:56643 stop:57806 length:1164 start_codon:yes stop_codon:yes gene_type:complete